MGRHLRSKLRLLLDCDGVLADFTTRVIQLINSVLGTKYTVEDIDIGDFCAALGLDRSDSARVKQKIGKTLGFAASILPYPSATAERVAKLQEIADVYIVTSPWNSNPTWVYEREAWLFEHYKIKTSNILHGSAKYICDGDVFVDDKVEALKEWQDQHPDGVAVKWETLHNSKEPWPVATNDWDVLLGIVKDQADHMVRARERMMAEDTLFCVLCFANDDDDGSWSGGLCSSHCFNCGAGGSVIQISKFASTEIRKNASWVGRRYYPNQEDKDNYAELTFLRSKMTEFPGRSAEEYTDSRTGELFWRILQELPGGPSGLTTSMLFPRIEGETPAEGIEKAKTALPYVPSSK
jgi:5'(3')-deoxyribonucleotidase